jgi:hypothetical protein
MESEIQNLLNKRLVHMHTYEHTFLKGMALARYGGMSLIPATQKAEAGTW